MKAAGLMAEYLPRSPVLRTTDFDTGTRFMGHVWERFRGVLRQSDYSLLINHIELDRSSCTFMQHTGHADLEGRGLRANRFRIFLHLDGEMELSCGKRRFVSNPDRIAVHLPSADSSSVFRPSNLLLFSPDGDLIRNAIAQRFRKVAAMEDWVGGLPQTDRAESFRSAAKWLASQIDAPGSPLGKSGKPRLHAEQMLVSLFVESLIEAAPGCADAALSLSETQVRMAEEWIEAHLAEPIGVDDVARAVEVGVRALQMSFQRTRGYSPSQAILRRRLEHARESLLNAPPGATVTSVAMDLGIFELGRFAKRYAERFGEAPSQTLARGRAETNAK